MTDKPTLTAGDFHTQFENIQNDFKEGKFDDLVPLVNLAAMLTGGDEVFDTTGDVNEIDKAWISNCNLLIRAVVDEKLNGFDPVTRLPINALFSNSHEPRDSLCIDIGTLINLDDYYHYLMDNGFVDLNELLKTNEPRRKDDWFICIKDHAHHYINKHNNIPNEAQLWSQMYSNPISSWNLTTDSKNNIVLADRPLDKEAFSKRYRKYFPTGNSDFFSSYRRK